MVELALHRGENYQGDGFSGNLPEPDPMTVAAHIYDKWLRAPCVLLEVEGAIVGFMGLDMYRMWWSPQPFVTDYMAYVLPEHRSLAHTKALYEAAFKFADFHGVGFVGQQMAMERLPARQRLMQRLGCRITGFTFMYEGKE